MRGLVRTMVTFGVLAYYEAFQLWSRRFYIPNHSKDGQRVHQGSLDRHK